MKNIVLKSNTNIAKILINKDKIISIAVLSTVLVLSLKYLLIKIYFVEDTYIIYMLSIISKLLVGVMYIIALPIVIKRDINKFVFLYLIIVIITTVSLLVYPNNRKYINDILFDILFINSLTYLYTVQIKDIKIFENVSVKFALYTFIINSILGILGFLKIIDLSIYSMTLGYSLLFSLLIYTREYLKHKNIRNLTVMIMSFAIIFIVGSRGPLLSFLIFIALYLLINRRNISNYLFIFLSFISLVVIASYRNILLLISSVIHMFGIESRTLYLLLQSEGTNLSGRDELYNIVLQKIFENPITGLGLAGDRLYLGTYSHNIILELLSHFGLIIGIILFIYILLSIYNEFRVKDLEYKNFLLIWFCLGFVPLFVSGSYLEYIPFWIFMGILNSKRIHKYSKK